jgi:protein TonB
MPSYLGTADRSDRARAIAAVAAVHAALAALILTGLNVRLAGQVVERLETFDIRLPPPAPRKPPPPEAKPHEAKKDAGAPAKQAEATPVLAPKPKLPVQSPIPAAPIAGTGSAVTSGAAAAGNGAGAGGNGNGPGGGGTDFSRFTPARLTRNLTRGDYRALAAGRLPAGRAMVSLRVEPSGQVTNCRIARSSGDAFIDSSLCPLVTERLRFRPALDDQGRPIPYQLQYVATWSL